MLLSQIKTVLDWYDREEGRLFGHFLDQRDIKRIRAIYDAAVQTGQAQLSTDAEVELFQCLCLSSCESGSDAWKVVRALWRALELPLCDGTPPFYDSFYFMNQKEMTGLSNRWKQLFDKKDYILRILYTIQYLLGPFNFGKYQRQHLLTPDNFQAIVLASTHAEDVARVLCTLNDANLLTPENRQAIVESKAHARGVAL